MRLKKAIKFKIGADEGCRFYFVVTVYPTQNKMYKAFLRHAKERGDKNPGLDFMAIVCRYFTIRPNSRLNSQIGKVFLSAKDANDVGLLAHELLHCALHYEALWGNIGGRKGWVKLYTDDTAYSPEERVCYKLEALLGEYHTKLIESR